MLIAISEIVKKSKTREEIIRSLEKMAGADGVDLGALDEIPKEKDDN